MNYLQGMSVAKDFEMSVSEVVTYGYIVVCIYRSPDGNFGVFLNNLELIIQKIQSKRKKIILCGDWNLNFFINNIKLQELENLLLSYDFKMGHPRCVCNSLGGRRIVKTTQLIRNYTGFDKLVHIHIVPVIVIVPGIRQQHPTNSTLPTH